MKKIGIAVVIIAASALVFASCSGNYDTQASGYLYSAMESQLTCMQASGEFTEDESVIKSKKGLGDKPDIHLEILQADPGNFIMEVYHKKGKKIFTGTLEYTQDSFDTNFLVTSRPR